MLHIFITKEPAFSGEIGNFLSGIGMILPVWFVLRKNENLHIAYYKPAIENDIEEKLLWNVTSSYKDIQDGDTSSRLYAEDVCLLKATNVDKFQI